MTSSPLDPRWRRTALVAGAHSSGSSPGGPSIRKSKAGCVIAQIRALCRPDSPRLLVSSAPAQMRPALKGDRCSATAGCSPPRTNRTGGRRGARVVPFPSRSGAVRRQGAVVRPDDAPTTCACTAATATMVRASLFRIPRGSDPTAAGAVLASVGRGVLQDTPTISRWSDG
jgi:hypothetical protein